MIDFKTIQKTDPEIFEAMVGELERQRSHIELIASENFVSPAVLATAGTHLTNKYAEGYPGKRYYGGCEWVDVAENLARDKSKANIRMRPCKCAAALRSSGEYCRLFCHA